MPKVCSDFKDDRITPANWEPLYDDSRAEMAAPDWPQEVLRRSKIEAVFLTNDFDDPLTGFDTKTYVPCLRTDDLVFNLHKPEVRERLERASKVPLNESSILDAIGQLFEHFTQNGGRACAISLPPHFTPRRFFLDDIPGTRKSMREVLGSNLNEMPEEDRDNVSQFVFWTLAEYCQEFHLPFDLMIGVNRGVYESGVHQGRDLYDSRVSLIQYKSYSTPFRA